MMHLIAWLFKLVLIFSTGFQVGSMGCNVFDDQCLVKYTEVEMYLYRCENGETFLATYFSKADVKYVHVKSNESCEHLLTWSVATDQGDVYVSETVRWEVNKEKVLFNHHDKKTKLSLISRVNNTASFYNESTLMVPIKSNSKSNSNRSTATKLSRRSKLVRSMPHRYL